MPKFRKRPVVIDAWQWITAFKHHIYPMPPAPHGVLRLKGWWKKHWEIKTPDGWVNLAPYDYVICGVKNDWYPCKPDIFEQTYDAVED